MTILSGDIVLLASQRLVDTDDGGGRITGREIISGNHNSMFPDISDMDRAYGTVNMRKAFLAVQTDDTDTYYGANAMVLLPPSDPSVNLTLMTTKDHNDTRDNARNTLERYQARGPKWQGVLYDTQLEGQRAIRILQRVEVRLPEVGEVLVLVGNEGKGNEVEQYVRVDRVTAELRKFGVAGNLYPNFDNASHRIIARPYHQLFGATNWFIKGLFGRFGNGLNIPNGPDNGFYVTQDPTMVIESGNHLRGYLPGLVCPFATIGAWDRKNFKDLPAMPGKLLRFVRVRFQEDNYTAGQTCLMGFDLTGPWR